MSSPSGASALEGSKFSMSNVTVDRNQLETEFSACNVNMFKIINILLSLLSLLVVFAFWEELKYRLYIRYIFRYVSYRRHICDCWSINNISYIVLVFITDFH